MWNPSCSQGRLRVRPESGSGSKNVSNSDSEGEQEEPIQSSSGRERWCEPLPHIIPAPDQH
ncbi:hypothetical protein BHM03_00058887 [Ensete ventricosum]|nr:hypothetical protein BHM03_00058887 [Ensete ventricosum]